MKTAYRVLVALVLLTTVAWALDAPQNFTATVAGDNVVFDWDDVTDAVKYSVDISADVAYTDLLGAPAQGTVQLSYGTSDRTDGGAMGDSNLTVAADTVLADIAAQLGVPVENIISVGAEAKVKALDPGKGKGAQNNPFSAPASFSLP